MFPVYQMNWPLVSVKFHMYIFNHGWEALSLWSVHFKMMLQKFAKEHSAIPRKLPEEVGYGNFSEWEKFLKKKVPVAYVKIEQEGSAFGIFRI